MNATFYAKAFGDPSFVASAHLISSVRVETLGGHAHIGVWNRGGKAGTLVVDASDASAIADILLPPVMRQAVQP